MCRPRCSVLSRMTSMGMWRLQRCSGRSQYTGTYLLWEYHGMSCHHHVIGSYFLFCRTGFANTPCPPHLKAHHRCGLSERMGLLGTISKVHRFFLFFSSPCPGKATLEVCIPCAPQSHGCLVDFRPKVHALRPPSTRAVVPADTPWTTACHSRMTLAACVPWACRLLLSQLRAVALSDTH